ncbi:MAG: dihydropteroate synthase [Planctomycetaceae bacterium]
MREESVIWQLPGGAWHPGPVPAVMGILNVTPDSFSDGGTWTEVDRAVQHGVEMQKQGAAFIDIGGESTRPGATPVSVEDELARVIPVIERLAKEVDVPLSIDTMKSRVAAEAVQAGAAIVNDVSAGLFDPNMAAVCASSNCGVILMHMLGTPQTMQENPHYGDVVQEVRDHLVERMAAFTAAGVTPERIVLDPGIGFGKTSAHNLDLLRHLDTLCATGRPVLIGHSRKRFLKSILGREVEERLAGTLGVAIAVAQNGAAIVRVHDVQAVTDALAAWHAVSADN